MVVEYVGLKTVGWTGGKASGKFSLFGLNSLKLSVSNATRALPMPESLIGDIDGFHGNRNFRLFGADNALLREEQEAE